MIVKAFFLGIASIIPAVIAGLSLDKVLQINRVTNPWILVSIEAFISAALFEELSKFLVFRIGIYKSKHYDEIVDGIIYMAIISLGFACLENIMYSTGDIITGILRAFTAVPGHAIWSGIMGYYFGLAVINKEKSKEFFFLGIIWGVIYHGGYDFVLFVGSHPVLGQTYSWLVFMIFPILIGGAVHLHRLIKKAIKMDKERTTMEAEEPVQ
jgi:RsiW-degrading membrane proteinase PrsW (M82 family)